MAIHNYLLVCVCGPVKAMEIPEHQATLLQFLAFIESKSCLRYLGLESF